MVFREPKMKPNLNRSSRRGLLLLPALLSLIIGSSCALTEEHINVGYVPESTVTTISGAQRAVVRVEVDDERGTKSHVGHKINGYGMEMAEIVADNDLPQTIKSAVESELRDRGFSLGSDGSLVAITLGKFENRFEMGFFSGTAIGEISMSVTVKRSGGAIAYTRNIHAEGVNSGVQLATGENTRIALEAALKNAVDQLFQDSSFVQSLLPQVEAPRKS
jgi:uncharacterized lipoprotein YajG